MQRVIVAPAALSGAPLAELKSWLAVTTAGEDDLLEAQLRAALDACEAFTGVMPLRQTCTETLPARAGWSRLATRPVQGVASVHGLDASGAAVALAGPEVRVRIGAGGEAAVRLLRPHDGIDRLVVRCSAGLAATWPEVPGALRQGIVRLAAHLHHARGTAGDSAPPAAVTALWRPWRHLRLT
ncbi:hypothetical protein EYB45_04005 [Erythrobacteraceae bacterium CFH 75059]|uniref:head-tail connector protein n=1 Tax=Qipengyuania thermophila TaxID=2509361 RepID=UPI00101E9B64|nr:hypothetical protein [Qipengyuania thermophila]TCD06848.1 hypothetical protein EYB45_04005 [Erythrobacteraceae bacterium CFH 75059]